MELLQLIRALFLSERDFTSLVTAKRLQLIPVAQLLETESICAWKAMARLWLSEEEASLSILWSKKLKMISNFEADQVDPSIFFSRKCTLLACADHGVASHGVSAFDDSVTLQMIKNYLIHRGAAANVFSKFAGADLFVVDVGVRAETQKFPMERKIFPKSQRCLKLKRFNQSKLADQSQKI